MNLGSLLALPGAVLNTAATALRILAAVNEALAERIAGGGDQHETDQPATPPARSRPASPPATPTAPAAAPATKASTVEPAAGDIPALAALPAPQVIAALDGLSTIELADLYEYESRRRRRRTVLTAIEAATAPPPAARDDDVILIDDVREPDELVYSTQTPRR